MPTRSRPRFQKMITFTQPSSKHTKRGSFRLSVLLFFSVFLVIAASGFFLITILCIWHNLPSSLRFHYSPRINKGVLNIRTSKNCQFREFIPRGGFWPFPVCYCHCVILFYCYTFLTSGASTITNTQAHRSLKTRSKKWIQRFRRLHILLPKNAQLRILDFFPNQNPFEKRPVV